MTRPLYTERVLFVVGQQDAGKSVQLRSMFLDWRFGRQGEPLRKRGPVKPIALSNERTLYIKLMSPHEAREKPEDWLNGIKNAMGSGRWCFAGALQPNKANNMPDIVQCIQLFVNKFSPERTRVCFLSPDRRNRMISQFINLNQAIPALQSIEGVECASIDARSKTANGLFLADFFDFT